MLLMKLLTRIVKEKARTAVLFSKIIDYSFIKKNIYLKYINDFI